MDVKFFTFWIQKNGNQVDEYEDAFYPEDRSGIINFRKGDTICFAISDGASVGMLSKYFAKIVVQAFCKIGNLEGEEFFQLFLENVHNSWEEWKREYISMREKDNKPLQWNEKESIRRGTFSTVTGLTLSLKEDNIIDWKAFAIGDSCLFLISKDNIKENFPISKSSDFNSTPPLVSDLLDYNKGLENCVKFRSGEATNGDLFYLMTDALSAWFLKKNEEGETPWNVLSGFDCDKKEDFDEWINKLREKNEIQNDDTTLISIKIL
jgi:serine/threonine protein phosphatase PrpC